MKLFAVLFLAAVTLAAQTPSAGAPAPSNVRGKQYPWIHPDLRITFQFKAPEAKQVAVAARAADSGMNGNTPYEMARNGEGIWTVTTDPVRPGFHYYELIIDGTRMPDPASQTFFGWAHPTSGLEVPDPALDFYSVKDVPHGQVSIAWYHSKTTGEARRAYVYLPPNYEKNVVRYPVLYLQHGAGENETSWTWQGKANLILDNLIAEGKAVPMIVVMDWGYASKPDAEDQRGNGAFEEVMINDLIPFIDSTYRTRTTRWNRAIAGLSMGGGQALSVGFANLDRFSAIAALSGAGRSNPVETSGKSAEEINNELSLLWIGYGQQDGGYQRGKALHQTLDAAGVKHVWFEGPGGHEWQVWRKHLYEIAPRLFVPSVP